MYKLFNFFKKYITPVFFLIPYLNSGLGKGSPFFVHNSPYFSGG